MIECVLFDTVPVPGRGRNSISDQADYVKHCTGAPRRPRSWVLSLRPLPRLETTRAASNAGIEHGLGVVYSVPSEGNAITFAHRFAPLISTQGDLGIYQQEFALGRDRSLFAVCHSKPWAGACDVVADRGRRA